MKISKGGIYAALAAVMLVSALLLTTCIEPLGEITELETQQKLQAPPGMGYLKLNIKDSSGSERTITPTIPALNTLVYTITVTNGGTGSAFANQPIAYADFDAVLLEEGTYGIQVSAYIGTVTAGNLVAAGSTTGVSVSEGGANAGTIQMLAITAATLPGTFSWNITLPGNADTAVMNLTPLNSQDLTGTVFNTADYDLTASTNNVGTASLPAGYYRVTIDAEGTDLQSRKITWILHIMQNMTSSHAFTVANLNSVSTYTITFSNLDGQDGIPSQTLSYKHGEVLTDNTGYATLKSGLQYFEQIGGSYPAFDGWHTKNGTSGGVWGDEWIEGTSKFNKAITLYAKFDVADTYDVELTLGEIEYNNLSPALASLTINFSKADLGTTSAQVNLSITNAASLNLTSITWTDDADTTLATGASTYQLDFDTNFYFSDIGTRYIIIEATSGAAGTLQNWSTVIMVVTGN